MARAGYHRGMRTTMLALFLMLGCGEDAVPRQNQTDAPPAQDDAPAIDAPGLTLDCASYCGAIQTACTGTLAQYESVNACLGTCEHLPVGALGDMTGNTLGCRVYHTDFARQDPMTHCEHAGPAGGTMCGTTCEGFCSVAPIVCPTQWQANNCAQQCGGLATVPPYSINSVGDTIECRLYHLTNATVDPTTHCPHVDRLASVTCN